MSYKSLIIYQKAFALAMKIFRITKLFPKEELFGLTSQIRGSSRSVCSNLTEGYRKENTRHISLASLLMQTWKMQKQNSGWILRWLVNTYHKQIIMSCMQRQKKLDECLLL